MNSISCRNFVPLLSILLAAFALPAVAQPSTPVACGDVIDEPGRYHLEGDLHCELGFPPPFFCEDAAITIAEPGVVLDGRNHTLSGFPTGVGLRIESTRGARVRDLAVESFGTGVEVTGGGSHRLEGLTLFRNNDDHCSTGIGLLLEDTQGNLLRNSVVSSNRAWGVRIVSSRNNRIRDNEIVSNQWRTGDLTGNVHLVLAENNRIVGNDLSRGGLDGVRFEQSDGNVLARNVIDDTAAGTLFGTGVALIESDGNLIRMNVLDRHPAASPGSHYRGIAIFGGSTSNKLIGNEVEHHATGIWLSEGAQETLVVRNTATTNVELDGRDDSPDCGPNKWRSNRLEKTNQPCVR
ncbi:MAG TPA: NosD domain-containing protein [Thermoanaerobaculia bacterium]|nr:NosD domain-containing protein [Thermoanaerobaculia bacterium]